MSYRPKLEMEIKVGLFVGLGALLFMVGITILGSSESIFKPTSAYKAYYDDVTGLMFGAKVLVNGIRVGVVNGVGFDLDRKKIKVDFAIETKYGNWIRENSTAEIQTQGVLGDKFLAIETLHLDSNLLPVGSELKIKSGASMKQFLSDSGQLMERLNSAVIRVDNILKSFESEGRNETFFKHMAQASSKLDQQLTDLKANAAVKNMNEILGKINSGQGTVGALINDPSLYDDLKALLGGANRNRVMRNLIRQTIKEGDDRSVSSSEADKP